MKQSLKIIILFLSSLFSNCKSKTTKTQKIEITNLYVKDKNIHIVFSDDKQKQITFNGSDEHPFFYKNKKWIIFIRNVKVNGIHRLYERKKLMIVSIDDLTERTITEKKSYKDGNDNSNEIFQIENPTISIDKKSVYFSTEMSVTSNGLVKVNIETGKWDVLFPTNKFEYILNGSHKGQFLIVKSEIRDKGRAPYHMLVNEKGVVKKEFENYQSAKEFMETIKNVR